MKILLACHPLRSMNGVFFYVYELAKELGRLEHDVTITCKTIAYDPLDRLKQLPNVTVRLFDNLEDEQFDIIHLNQPKATLFLLDKYPETPAVSTIHSTVFDADGPCNDGRIYKHICIREDVQEYYQHIMNFQQFTVIPNGIDFEKFKPDPSKMKTDDRYYLFVGGMGSLRRRAIKDFAIKAKQDNAYLRVVGNFLSHLGNNHGNVYCYPFTWDIEKHVQGCIESAGIFMGRTTLESWACGKPSWIYNISKSGNVISSERVVTPDNVEDYNIKNVAGKLLRLYLEAIMEKGSTHA